jgi:Uma2 family endonuclease
MAVATKLPRPATEADLLALPEDGRGYELLDGEIVEKETAFRHGRAQIRLGQRLEPYDRRSGGGDRPGGWWFLIEQLVRFESGQTLRPDVAGWLRDRLPELPEDDDTVVLVLHDWIAEILSPSNATNDTIKKKRIYHHHGVPHYWIIDPHQETLTVQRWTPEGYVEVLSAERGDRVRPEPFAAAEWLVGVLFGDDDDGPP